MNRNALLVLAGLVASVALNAVLALVLLGDGDWDRDDGSHVQTPMTTPSSSEAKGGGTGPTSRESGATEPSAEVGDSGALEKRVQALETELDAARRKLELFERIPLKDMIVSAKKSLRWKLEQILHLPEEDGHSAAWQIGRRKDLDSAEVYALLEKEGDPGILFWLAYVIRAGGLGDQDPEMMKNLDVLLSRGKPPERRLCAAFGLPSQYRLKEDQEPVWRQAVYRALEQEKDERVLAALCARIGRPFRGDPELAKRLGQTVQRMKPGQPRRDAFHALGSCASMGDPFFGLFEHFASAKTQDYRADAAAAIALLANQGTVNIPEDPVARRRFRDRFIEIYRTTTERETRNELLHGAYTGWNLLHGKEAASLAEDLAAVETDAVYRERLYRIARILRDGYIKSSGHLKDLLEGKE